MPSLASEPSTRSERSMFICALLPELDYILSCKEGDVTIERIRIVSEDMETLKEFGATLEEFERLNNSTGHQIRSQDRMLFPQPDESFYIPAGNPVQFSRDFGSFEEEEK